MYIGKNAYEQWLPQGSELQNSNKKDLNLYNFAFNIYYFVKRNHCPILSHGNLKRGIYSNSFQFKSNSNSKSNRIIR